MTTKRNPKPSMYKAARTTKSFEQQVAAIRRRLRELDRASVDPEPRDPRDKKDTYALGDVIVDVDGLPWRYEPRWPGDTNPWAYCG